jgi:hypothetical protein
VRENAATQLRLKAADQQEDAVVEPTLDPGIVTVHELAGRALVDREPEQDDIHHFLSSM